MTASTAKKYKNGKQYDFHSSTEIIAEFEALDQELIQLKVR